MLQITFYKHTTLVASHDIDYTGSHNLSTIEDIMNNKRSIIDESTEQSYNTPRTKYAKVNKMSATTKAILKRFEDEAREKSLNIKFSSKIKSKYQRYDSDSDDTLFDETCMWHGFQSGYIVPCPEVLPNYPGPNDFCSTCRCSPCNRIVFGKYLLQRLVDNGKCYDEWSDYIKDFGIDYFYANEFTSYNKDPNLYKAKYIDLCDSDSDPYEYFDNVPECVRDIFYAFRNFLIKNRNKCPMSWPDEFKTFMKVYDKNGHIH